MGTKTTSTNAINYNPQSMNQYQSFWGMASPLLNSLIQNPYNNSTYNLNLQQATKASQQLGGQTMQNALSNLQTAGIGSNSGLAASTLAGLSRFGSNLTNQGFLAAANQAQSNMWNAMGIQASRSPLVMGNTQTQQTSGLGTWLPQVAGMGISALTGGLAGGVGAATKTAGNILSQPSTMASSPFLNSGGYFANSFAMPPGGASSPGFGI